MTDAPAPETTRGPSAGACATAGKTTSSRPTPLGIYDKNRVETITGIDTLPASVYQFSTLPVIK